MTIDLDRRSALAGLIGLAGMVLTSGRARAATDAAACAPGGSAQAMHEVEIKDFAFLPETLAARLGDMIRWTNTDLSPHTATALDGSWDTGEIGEGQSVALVVTDAMSSAYHCLYHTHMSAGLIVCRA